MCDNCDSLRNTFWDINGEAKFLENFRCTGSFLDCQSHSLIVNEDIVIQITRDCYSYRLPQVR